MSVSFLSPFWTELPLSSPLPGLLQDISLNRQYWLLPLFFPLRWVLTLVVCGQVSNPYSVTTKLISRGERYMVAQKTLVEPKNFNLQPHLTNIISSTFSFLKAAFLWHKLKPLLWNWALLWAALEWGEVYLKGHGLWSQVHCVCVRVCLRS